MQRKETNDLKVCTEWTQKWMSPNRIRKNNDLHVHEIVRGPFSSPKLLVSQPIIAISTCQRQAANFNENRNDLRHGIPDAWKEYLARKGLCHSMAARVLQKNLIPSYVRSFATDRIWNELGLPLMQGIPDPWKCKFLFQRRSDKCLRRRCAYNNNVSTQITCIYDGDDEAEIEHSVKSQFNKNRVVNKTDFLHDDNKELSSSPLKKIALKKCKNDLEKVKSNVSKHDDQPSIDKNSKWTSQHGRPMQTLENDVNKKKNISTAQKIDNMKSKRKSTQTNVIPTKDKLVSVDKPNVCKGTTKETEKKNHLEKNIQNYSNIVCCNCTLLNHVHSNIKNFPEYASLCKGMNVSNLVLCKNCENIYCNRDSQQLKDTVKTVVARVPNSKNAMQRNRKKNDKQKKNKLSDYSGEEKTQFKQENLIDIKSTICCEEELKVVCGRCNNPYLKIASYCDNATDQKTRSCVFKKEDRNKSRNGISKHPMKQSNNIVRSSKNYICTRNESKMHVPKGDLERTPCSIRTGNNTSKKNSYDDDVTISAINMKIKVNLEDHDQMCVEDNIKVPEEEIIPKCNQHSRSYIDGGKGKDQSEDNPRNAKKKTIKRKNKNMTNTMIVEEKDNVKQFHQVRFDPILKYVVSDNDEYADVSDNFIDDGTNATCRDRLLSVTSVTFMRRLQNTIPIRKLYWKSKLQKIYRAPQEKSRNNKLNFEQISKIEDNTMNDNENDVSCDVLYCSELAKDDNSET